MFGGSSIENVIIDTDIGDGIDDAFGLVGAQLSDSITIQAVVTCWGDVVRRAQLARTLLYSCGGANIPVFAGAFRSMSSDEEIQTAFDSDGGALYSDTTVDSRPGVDYMVDSVSSDPQNISIVAIGPLTNIASCIQLDSSFASNLKRLVVMGGRSGDSMHLEERNFDDDPVATEIVLNSDANLLVVPFEPSSKVVVGHREMCDLHDSGTECCQLLSTMLRQYLAIRRRASTPLFDLATIGCMECPDLATFDYSGLSVTRMGKKVRLVKGEQLTARLVTQFDGVKYMAMFMDKILGCKC